MNGDYFCYPFTIKGNIPCFVPLQQPVRCARVLIEQGVFVTIFRYFAKEILTALSALTSILLLIFLSNQFVHYLTRAAEGQFPAVIVMRLMMLEIPNLLGLLLPLGLFIAILIAYGRMYAESEMTVLEACGFSQMQLISMTMILAAFVTAIVAVLVLWLSPMISADRDRLLTGGGAAALIATIIPGRFQEISSGKRVLYVEQVKRDRERASNIFLAEQQKSTAGQNNWNVVTAHSASVEVDKKTGQQFVVLHNGNEYSGIPGNKDFRIISFDRYVARVPQPKPEVNNKARALPTSNLWHGGGDRKKAAELQWRLSVPIMTLVLALLAVPMSRVNPRQGKFAKLLPSIIIYIVYANLMFISRDWLASGKIPLWLGMWWLHVLVLLLALVLIAAHQWRGFFKR